MELWLLPDRFAWIRDNEFHIIVDNIPKSFAFSTGTQRTVETVESRLRGCILKIALIASIPGTVTPLEPRPVINFGLQ